MRRTYLNLVYTLFIGVALTVTSIIVLAIQTIPYTKVVIQQWYGSIVATCECSGATLLTQQPWFSAFALVSVITAGLVMSWLVYRFVYAYMQTRRFQNRLTIHHVDGKPSVTYCYGVPIYQIYGTTPLAVTIGFRSPAVYISRELKHILDPWEYWAVIKHELNHALYRDPLHRFLLHMLRPVLRIIPKLLHSIIALQELAADEAAQDDKALRSALLKLYDYETSQSSHQPQSLSSSSSNHDTVYGASYFSVTEVRIDRLLGQIPSGYSLRGMILTMMLAVGVLTAVNHVMANSDSNMALASCLEQQPMCQAVMTEVRQLPRYYVPIHQPMSIERSDEPDDWIVIFN